jgi:hypothetical protein
MFLIYGSQAIKHWYPDYDREPRDTDIITDDVSFLNNSSPNRKEEFYWTNAFEYLIYNKDNKYVDPNLLYTIKVSHAAWDINWTKTMKDIEFLQSKGCKLDTEFYNLLYSDWEKLHGKKKVKMDVENKEFFTETITRKYNHEELHKHFMFYDRPLNERIRPDLNSPLCSKKMWNKLHYVNKIKCALEEIFVLATERYIVNGVPSKTARVKTLKQMITSSTSGWFNLFLVENFSKLRVISQERFEQKLKELEG